MSRTGLTKSTYQKALAAIKKEIVGGLLRAEKELAYQKLLTYWNVGRVIQRDILVDRKEPEHGSSLYKRFSGDLGIAESTISRTVHVFNAFPNKPKNDGLNWSNYLMLVRVPDARERLSLKRRILKEHLTDPELRLIVKTLRQPKDFIVNIGKA